jgi:hypothetical protein
MMRVGPQGPAVRLMLISLVVWGGQVHALGLGAIALQSGLGRPLQARIPVYGLAADDAGTVCLKSRVLALDGSLLSRPTAELTGSGAGAMVNLRSVESISEPAVNVSVEIGCNSAVKREYQLLLDPLPAILPMAASTPPARVDRAERRAASQAGVIALPAEQNLLLRADTAKAPIVAKAPASIVRKQPAPVRLKPDTGTKSVLTLTGGDAEIEQVRARIALRSATVLSEPRVEIDPAKLSALRADQVRVAALLRGENPLAGTQAQLRDAESKLLAVQKSAASAALRHEQEKTTLTAAQEDMVSGKLAALLGALLLVCIAVIGWLLWRRANDRRRQEQAFFAMTPEQEAQAGMDASLSARSPVSMVEPRLEAEPADFTMPADDLAPAPLIATARAASSPTYDWRPDAGTPMVSSSPPESLQMSESWLTIQDQAEEIDQQASRAASLPLSLAAPDDNAEAHAAEVAGMLLAAESWMVEHNPLRAAEVLRPYLDRDDVQSPAPGLYLLSLYRTMDNKEQVLSILAKLQKHFPEHAAEWSSSNQSRRSMADFPLVHAVVDTLVDTDKLLPYLNSLLLAPEQFDFSTYRDIVRAIALAKEMKQENDMQSMSLDFQ